MYTNCSITACSFCSASDHSTYICPVLSQGEHVSYIHLSDKILFTEF